MKRAKIYKPDIDETYSLVNNGTGEVEAEINNGCSVKVNPEDDGFIHNYHRGDGFVKLLDSAVPKMMQVLTKAEMWVAIGIANYVSYDDNILRDDTGRHLDIKDLCEPLNMNYDSLRKIMTGLKKKGVIYVGSTGSREAPHTEIKSIVANPRIYFRGTKERREIDGLFEGSLWG